VHPRAFFIVLEGGDGAGKTIQAKLLCSALRRRGYKIHATAEPSKSDVGKLIRRSVLQKRKISPESEALLFAADRFLHLESEIRPALSAGTTVVCDRYMYASFAYQGAQGVDREWLRAINRFAEKPDLAIYLDVPSNVSLRRIRRKKSVMETFGLQQQVREEYAKLVESGELVAVDSNRPIQNVAGDILALVADRLRDPR
jgi:dTMP kinase